MTLIAALAFALLQDKSAYLPLSRDAKWTYKTGYGDNEMVYAVNGTEKIGEVECFVVDHRMNNERSLRKEWLAADKDGIKIYKTARGKSELSVEKPFFLVKNEMKKDDSWTGEAKGTDVVMKYEFTVEDEVDVEVPAGKFKAWKVHVKIASDQTSVDGYQWYAKNVGMVKLEWGLKLNNEMNDVLYELKAFGKARDEKEYFPVKKGSKWTYKVGDGEVTVTAEGTEKVGDQECAVLLRKTSQGEGKEYFAVTDKGVFLYKLAGNEFKDNPIPRLKFGTKKGDTWEWKTDEQEGKYENKGEEEVEVPAGKYKAWKIKVEAMAQGTEYTVTRWFVANVGLVKEEISRGGETSTLELKKFEEGK